MVAEKVGRDWKFVGAHLAGEVQGLRGLAQGDAYTGVAEAATLGRTDEPQDSTDPTESRLTVSHGRVMCNSNG
jgi:hypothetical protein